MPDTGYRFGEFLVDRAQYRILRNGAPLEVTPKLLDLLLYLLDHAGRLVTKEELLDALWPDANVTDNALAQAMSELRDAIGDDPTDARYIKTIARRGYRFIAPVHPTGAIAPTPPTDRPASIDAAAIAVLDFTNVSGAVDAAWLSAGIAETVSGDLRALDRFRVIDRLQVVEAARRTDGSMEQISAALNAGLIVVGSYQATQDRVRITCRIVNVTTGEAIADAKVDGALAGIFDLQDEVGAQLSRELGVARGSVHQPRETPSLEAYRAFTEGWLDLETLDLRHIPGAAKKFARAIELDGRYALAYTGLASAELASYESTRWKNVPDAALLQRSVEHARHAVSLDESLAEAHATLALVLVSAWETETAVQAARRAVTLDSSNWRNFFRLGHAAWGRERLRAADKALELYPEFAFAHFQKAMVHVARGDLREAETVLRQGAAVQDRQIARGDRYPALGLHWLLALVRLAAGDAAEGLREIERELSLSAPTRLYGQEYELNAYAVRGWCHLHLRDNVSAATAFRQALGLYNDHPHSHIGLAVALRGSGDAVGARIALDRANAAADALEGGRPIEAALVRAEIAAVTGNSAQASEYLTQMLSTAPPGFAGWTIPVEPSLLELIHKKSLIGILGRLRERAA